MQSNEERVAAVKRRANELEIEAGKRHRRIVRLSAVAVCLLLIVGLSLSMPGILGRFSGNVNSYSDMAASAFQNSSTLGFIVIGVISFALGVCVTVLCFRMRRSESEKEAEEPPRDNDD